jgi:hypothetical protein
VYDPPGLVRPVPWDEALQKQWAARRLVAESSGTKANDGLKFMKVNGYVDTGNVLALGLPRYANGIVAVANYASLEEARDDLGLASRDPSVVEPALRYTPAPIPGGAICTAIGCEFLVPSDDSLSSEALLGEAVAIARDKRFRRGRAAY